MTAAPAGAVDSTGCSGRVALVTGAAGGIGRAVCGALEQRGARVVAADIVLPTDSANCDFARTSRAEVHLDVSSKAEVGALIARVAAALARSISWSTLPESFPPVRPRICPKKNGIASSASISKAHSSAARR